MTPRHAFIVLVFLLTASLAFAEGLSIQSPTGDTIDPAESKFSYSIDSYDVIAECRLIIDGNVSKRAMYGEVIKGRSLSFAADYEDGTYVWRIECDTEDGTTFASEDRTVTIERQESEVTVTPSGVFRGSMLHSFTLQAGKTEGPILIPKVAAGDYLGITVAVYPSKLTKELYVKSRLAEEGVPKLWMTYKQEDYYVSMGEEIDIPLSGTAKVILRFENMTLNRAVLSARLPTAEAPTEEPQEPAEEPAQEPETPQEPAQEPSEEPATPEPQTEDRPGFMTRFVSWLVGLFGA